MVSSFSYASAPALPPTVTTRKDLKGDTIFIIDGTAMLYKCFFGLGRQKYFKELTTVPQHEDDEPKHCGAVAAMATMFTRFCKNVRPSYVAVVFDASRKTFRNRLYPEYKQQREEVGTIQHIVIVSCWIILPHLRRLQLDWVHSSVWPLMCWKC